MYYTGIFRVQIVIRETETKEKPPRTENEDRTRERELHEKTGLS
jgi:hypothetical protein